MQEPVYINTLCVFQIYLRALIPPNKLHGFSMQNAIGSASGLAKNKPTDCNVVVQEFDVH